MSLSKSENKLLEITWDPYFEDIEWEYCKFGAVQMGEGEGGEKFYQGFEYGSQQFFWNLKCGASEGATTFFEVEKVGQEFFWPVKSGEGGWLEVFSTIKFPRTRLGYLVNFGQSLSMKI